MGIVIFGIDAHKRSHTVVAIDEVGRQLGQHTTRATGTADHLQLLSWAQSFGLERRWAVEDCRHLSRRLEADLLAAGQLIQRVPPKMMAHARDAARSYGKSDPIDALAVARAALREPDLPTARLDGASREVRVLVDHRADLVAERTRHVNRLRWYLHEIDPGWDPKPKALCVPKHLRAVEARLAGLEGPVAQVAADLTRRVHELTIAIRDLHAQIIRVVTPIAENLLAVPGVAALTAAMIIGQTADIDRFRSRSAYARHNGTAPLPAWSGNTQRHRLSRIGNRQLNASIHRIAITQARSHPAAIEFMDRRRHGGSTRPEAIRALKRRLSDVVFRALTADARPPAQESVSGADQRSADSPPPDGRPADTTTPVLELT